MASSSSDDDWQVARNLHRVRRSEPFDCYARGSPLGCVYPILGDGVRSLSARASASSAGAGRGGSRVLHWPLKSWRSLSLSHRAVCANCQFATHDMCGDVRVGPLVALPWCQIACAEHLAVSGTGGAPAVTSRAADYAVGLDASRRFAFLTRHTVLRTHACCNFVALHSGRGASLPHGTAGAPPAYWWRFLSPYSCGAGCSLRAWFWGFSPSPLTGSTHTLGFAQSFEGGVLLVASAAPPPRHNLPSSATPSRLVTTAFVVGHSRPHPVLCSAGAPHTGEALELRRRPASALPCAPACTLRPTQDRSAAALGF